MAQFDTHDTQEKVIAIIAEVLHIPKEQISGEATLDQLGADSLDKLEIVMKLEEMFGIEIDDEQAAQINSISQAIEKIHQMRSK
jgi:acyl carrier protein